MQILRAVVVPLVITSMLVLSSCSSGTLQPVSDEGRMDPVGFAPALPMEPVEPRTADAVSGAFKLGNELDSQHNATVDGTNLHLFSPVPPGDYTSWATYEFPDLGMQPLTLTVLPSASFLV